MGISRYEISDIDIKQAAECMISEDMMETEQFEKEAWPDIAKKYNGGDDYKNAFIENNEKWKTIISSPKYD